MDFIELDPEVHAAIKSLCAEGDALADKRLYAEAIEQYSKAWTLVPEPTNEWNAATWILAAIADACFLMGDGEEARRALEYAMTCPGGIGNPFLHLRFGQILFDAGELDAAADELIRAYMGAGDDIFRREDTKYLDFLRTRAKL